MDLFDENGDWTQEAADLVTEIEGLMLPILDRYVEAGYRSREVAYVMHEAVSTVVAMQHINRRYKEKQTERESLNKES